MGLDRPLADVQATADLGVRAAVGHEREHLSLPVGEDVETVEARAVECDAASVLGDPLRDGSGQHGIPGRGGPDR